MKTETEQTKKFLTGEISIALSKIFTYPTRLAGAWKASIMEINLPADQINSRKIEVNIRRGSTNYLGIKNRNIYKRIYKNLAKPIQVDDSCIYDSRYDTDGNIAHIITNVAPAVLIAKNIYPSVRVVLRANASSLAKNAYKLLGIPVLCTDKNVYGKLILAPDGANGTYEGLYSTLFSNLAFEGFNTQTPERVFISRKGKRRLMNEHEIEQTLQEYGFEKFYFEDIPLSEQWSIARNAKVVVGLHGAALASLVFNNSAVKVVELFHPGYVVNMYRRITNAMRGKWCGVTGQLAANVIKELDFNQRARSFALSPTRIDPTSLCMALQHLDVK